MAILNTLKREGVGSWTTLADFLREARMRETGALGALAAALTAPPEEQKELAQGEARRGTQGPRRRRGGALRLGAGRVAQGPTRGLEETPRDHLRRLPPRSCRRQADGPGAALAAQPARCLRPPRQRGGGKDGGSEVRRRYRGASQVTPADAGAQGQSTCSGGQVPLGGAGSEDTGAGHQAIALPQAPR